MKASVIRRGTTVKTASKLRQFWAQNVATEFVQARKAGSTGKVVEKIIGQPNLWLVRHDNNDLAVYYTQELEAA